MAAQSAASGLLPGVQPPAGAQLCQCQQQNEQKRAERRGPGLGADHQEHAHGGHARQFRPGQPGAAQQHPRQQQAEHHPAEGVGVAVAEHQAVAAVALTGRVGRDDARKVQQLHQRQRRHAAGQKCLHHTAQRHVLGGQQGHAKPQPPDVLPVEVDPPRHKVQQPGADHAAAIVLCAQQDLKAEAEIHDPVQHGETRVCSQGQFSRAMLLLNTTMNSYTITPRKNAHAPYFCRTDA